jgi:peptide/nickel transport system permease protein
MISYIGRRIAYMLVVLFVISIITFILIQLPPGDFVTSYVAQMIASGRGPSDRQAYEITLRKQFGLDDPIYVQYGKWLGRMIQGDLGQSLAWHRPVSDLILERLFVTVTLALATLVFIYAVAIPIGIYSATHQYSVLDYSFTVVGFTGMAIPEFLFALILMAGAYKVFGLSIGRLFSSGYESAPWSLGKLLDMVTHLPIPILVVGLAGSAGIIRIMRGCLLDELRKQYVVTARAKGVRERTLLFRYPVRIALNPIVSTVGWDLPWVISGQTIASIVLNLPTLGPLLFQALMTQDMYLAGGIVLILSTMTVIGTFLSDMLLAWLDPRIRLEKARGEAT